MPAFDWQMTKPNLELAGQFTPIAGETPQPPPPNPAVSTINHPNYKITNANLSFPGKAPFGPQSAFHKSSGEELTLWNPL